MNGRAVDCDLSDAHYARDARWHIAQSLGAAIAKVELVVAGAALDEKQKTGVHFVTKKQAFIIV